MKKILLFSFFLMLGLVVSQFLPAMVGEGYSSVKTISNTLLYVCLAFIMINVGREFEMDKSRWRSYTEDYFIAMATAAFPWIFVALYYMFVLLPDIYWNSGEAWKENLLLSRFAAPTSAGILFTIVGGGRVEIFLGIQESAGIGNLRRPRYDSVDDSFADYDGRLALAVGRYHSDCDGPIDHRMEKDGKL